MKESPQYLPLRWRKRNYIKCKYRIAKNCLCFAAPDKDWLRYIASNRTGKVGLDEFDLVIGPVANDQAIRTINSYLKGHYPEHIAIELLLPQKLKDQYTFKTEKALELLHFKKAVTL